MRNIKYIVRKRAMGDVLWTEPVIRTLAQRNEHLIVHTKFNALFENFPYKNVHFKDRLTFWEKCLIALEKKLNIQLFTLNLDNAYEKHPHLHLLHAYQEKSSLPVTHEYPRLYLSEQEKQNRLITDKYVVLHLESFSTKIYRHVFGVDWNTITDHFSAQGLKVIQIGLDHKPIENALKIQTSVRELISLIYHCDFFIGLDSGPSHIAASLGKRSIIFFGAVKPDTRHFPDLFKGFLVKQPCEYDNNYDKVISDEDLPCRLSSDPGIAKCCVYTTDKILLKINQLMKINAT